ncbi:hypothetical protein FD755_016051 [Muntiacus reevesi]|uniref:Vasculin-like protein 1 n=1 Tax=Muntiacus reevesi TaxID=9886 RepID=A0A5N3XDT8_MUNRE|nr:hypothetical protein FD755_016051 [Muntiacus reevesi]
MPSWVAVSPTVTFEKHGEHLPKGDGRFGVSRRRHNSSDGFFNNGSLRTTGAYAGIIGNLSGWNGSSRGHDGMSQRSRGGTGNHCHWNGSFHSQKGCLSGKATYRYQGREERRWKKAGKQNQLCRPIGTPSGPWKMLVIKKLSREDPAAAFSAAFTSPGSHHVNENKSSTMVPSVYKNLVPKPVPPPSKSVFTSPIPVAKPLVLAGGVVLSSPKESPASTIPLIEISSSRLTKLTHRTTDKKSKFLKTLKDDQNGDFSESRECEKLEDLKDNSTPEPKENEEEGCHQNGLALPVVEEGKVLFHSLEAEHRLLKAMGWQEYPENDENCLPFTEDELRELHMKTKQLRRNGFGKNSFLQSRSSNLFSPRRSTSRTEFEDSAMETSSSETSDDDA